MRFLRRFLTRLKNFATGQRDDQRLREEMEEHLALQTAENLRAGMPPAEARRQAVLKFGAVGTIREDYHAEQGLPFIETLLQDVRYALRLFAKSPGFAAVAILTMALGIGATTAIFSVVDATLLHPLSYPHPEQLVRIEDDLPGVGAREVGISIPEWKDLERSGIFQYVSLVGGGSVNLTGSSQPARIAFLSVTPNYLAMLGVKPELGRWFDPDDQTPGFTLDVLISDGLWKRAFGGDPHIVGKSLRLDNDLYRVIGVMPAGFHDPGRTTEQRNTELWAATGFAAAPAPPPTAQFAARSGLSRAPQTWLDSCSGAEPAGRTRGLFAETIPGRLSAAKCMEGALVPLKESVVGNVRESLMLLLGAVGLVLLIGCVNVANLHAGARQRQRARDGGSPGTGGRAEAAGAAVAHREPAPFAARRDSRFGDSLRHQGISAAHDPGEPAAAQ